MSYSKDFNKRARREHAFLSMDGESALEAGLQLLNNAPPESERIRKNDKIRLSWNDLIQLLQLAQVQLSEFLYEMDLLLIEANRRLLQLNNLQAECIAIDHCLASGKPERYDDGTLKNTALRNAVEKYMEDHDINAEFLNDDAFILVIVQDMASAYPGTEQIDKLIELQKQKIDILRSGKKQAESLQRDLGNAENLQPESAHQLVSDVNAHMENVRNMVDALDQQVTQVENKYEHGTVSEHIQYSEGTVNSNSSEHNVSLPESNMQF